ncbi:MAG: xanthine dehydrogenase family protein subunit M [Acidimicrobiia bacterium]|nr:xanthine dehydrogenase family protein subunit M [Acidimicrobiia bacterium]
MKSAPFDYLAPSSIDDAIAALVEYRGTAKVLAGGQSLVPMLGFRLVRPAALIDLRHITGLTGISPVGDTVSIGAMTTHRSVELHQELIGRCPMVREALGVVGHVSIRNRGTVGGSMAHADPAAEWPTLALALDAEFAVTGLDGERVIAAEDFFTDWMTTSMRTDELLTRVDLAIPPPGVGTAFLEVARRHGDFGLAGVATVLGIEDGVVSHARVSLLGLGLTALRARETEEVLLGREPSEDALVEAADHIEARVKPLSDQHATEDYKRHLGRVLTVRTLRLARERASRAGQL